MAHDCPNCLERCDCGADDEPGDCLCPDDCNDAPAMMFLIEMAWWCWDCAENIGQSFIEKERPRTDSDKCYGCERKYT